MPVQKILLIDYEPRSVRNLREPLERAGYSVHIAQDGLAGIDAFKKLEPDLVMIEAMIPKKNGFEVCHDLKQTPRGRETPILIITSVYKGRKYRNEALHKYGCDEFLEKPIPEDKLLTTIRGFLGQPAATPAPAPAAAAQPEAAAAKPDPPATKPEPPAPKPEPARAAQPPPAPVAAMPGAAAAASPVTDFAELEIIEKLDQLLPGDQRTEKATLASPPATPAGDTEKVVSFDPERTRKRRGAPSPPVPAIASGAPSTRGGAEVAHVADDLPAPIGAEVAAPDALSEPVVESAPGRGRAWIWVVLTIGLIVVGSAAAYLTLVAR